MKTGDLVRWVGFPGASIPPSASGPGCVGIIVKVWKENYYSYDERIDVLWGTGKFGTGLYPQTIEVI